MEELQKKVDELAKRVAALEAKLGKLTWLKEPGPSPFSGAHAKADPPPETAINEGK